MKDYVHLSKLGGPADLQRLSIDDLGELAAEIRQAICDQVSRSGGHLAPNLGVVELTLALHRVFDFSHDRLIFDVGHQCYTHKLVTGRQGLLDKLRQRDGMAGFPEPHESDYDQFSVGHAGTGVSTAVGMARGDELNGEIERKTVALVGDSSIVNGLAMEGLNNAGTLKRQFLVVLNDNGMSIGQPQGALAGYFDKVRLSPRFSDLKSRAQEVLKKLPASEYIEEIYNRLGEMTKAALNHSHLYEHFGLLCVGPIDGHDLPGLIEMLEEVKQIDRPVLLHVKTVKGKGFEFSSEDPTTFHSPKPFVINGCRAEVKTGGRSFTAAYSDALVDLMKRDEKVVTVTAGMADGTGVAKAIRRFPERAWDVGIAEEHAVDMCAGMAKTGLKPFVTIYSTFLQRGIDQVFQEVALQGLPVRFCMDRAGLVGGDGAVHHGFMDVAGLRSLPGMVLTAAMDEPTLRGALDFMLTRDDGPSAVRYPRDDVPDPVQKTPPPFDLGRANLLAEGTDLAILAYGFPANHALEAREQLAAKGWSVAVYDARFAKPVDLELVRELIEGGTPILTVEDHSVAGGFGTAVVESCNGAGLRTDSIHRSGLPDRWIYQGSRAGQLAEAGIDAVGIAARAADILESMPHRERVHAREPKRRAAAVGALRR
jgi:1-deoxy-D-xylulose-5-phosphate synthase